MSICDKAYDSYFDNWDEKEENRHTKAMIELTDLIPKVLKKFI